MHLIFGLCTFPTDTFPFTCYPFNGPGMCLVDNLQRLIFVNSQSPNKFTGKPKIFRLPTSLQESIKHKSTFMFTFIFRTIYEVNDTALYLERFLTTTNNNAILAILLHHKEDNFLKLMVKNRSKIDCNKYIPNKW